MHFCITENLYLHELQGWRPLKCRLWVRTAVWLRAKVRGRGLCRRSRLNVCHVCDAQRRWDGICDFRHNINELYLTLTVTDFRYMPLWKTVVTIVPLAVGVIDNDQSLISGSEDRQLNCDCDPAVMLIDCTGRNTSHAFNRSTSFQRRNRKKIPCRIYLFRFNEAPFAVCIDSMRYIEPLTVCDPACTALLWIWWTRRLFRRPGRCPVFGNACAISYNCWTVVYAQ